MKLYTSIKRHNNYGRRNKFEQGEPIMVQEKIDGSNVGFMNDGGKLRIFSRRNELDLQGSDFKGFEAHMRAKATLYLSVIPDQVIVFGEWLGMAKIAYNGAAGQGKVPRLWLFDAAIMELNDFGNDYDEDTRNWYSIADFVILANKLEENIVPLIGSGLYDDDFDYHSLIHEKSLIHEDSYMEGVVVKSIDGKKRMKWVGQRFSEAQKVTFKPKQKPFAEKVIDTYLTQARFDKYETKMLEDGVIPSLDRDNATRGMYYRNANKLVDDIFEEEKEKIIKELLNMMRKSANGKITEFYEKN